MLRWFYDCSPDYRSDTDRKLTKAVDKYVSTHCTDAILISGGCRPSDSRRLSPAVSDGNQCPLWVDAVEKGKNELTEIFPCVPVETDIS